MIIEISEENFEQSINDNKPILIDFWATWCAPCIAEIPNYNELNAKYAAEGQDVVLVGVLEDFIRAAPEQYQWFNRRFKGRPAEWPDLYLTAPPAVDAAPKVGEPR